MKRKLSILLTVALVFGLCAFLVQPSRALDAAEGAVLNGLVKITLDGERIIPVDVNGAAMLPITYNGATYLPLRAMVQLFGVTVAWDGDNSTVYMKSVTGKKVPEFKGTVSASQTPAAGTVFMPWVTLVLDGVEIIPIGEDALPVSPLLYSERIYLPLRAMASFLDVNVAWDSTTDTVVLTTIDRRGPAGPAGSAGSAGSAGPAGPQGPAGKDGTPIINAFNADLSNGSPYSMTLGESLVYRLMYDKDTSTFKLYFAPATGVEKVNCDYYIVFSTNKTVALGGHSITDSTLIADIIISDSGALQTSCVRIQNPAVSSAWSTYEIKMLSSHDAARVTIWVTQID